MRSDGTIRPVVPANAPDDSTVASADRAAATDGATGRIEGVTESNAPGTARTRDGTAEIDGATDGSENSTDATGNGTKPTKCDTETIGGGAETTGIGANATGGATGACRGATGRSTTGAPAVGGRVQRTGDGPDPTRASTRPAPCLAKTPSGATDGTDNYAETTPTPTHATVAIAGRLSSGLAQCPPKRTRPQPRPLLARAGPLR